MLRFLLLVGSGVWAYRQVKRRRELEECVNKSYADLSHLLDRVRAKDTLTAEDKMDLAAIKLNLKAQGSMDLFVKKIREILQEPNETSYMPGNIG